MTSIRRAALALISAFAISITGCGGCQDEKPQAASAPQVAATSAPAAVEATKAAQPTRAVPPVMPTVIQGEGHPEDEAAANAQDEDCFVMMDAFPDYGAPPLKVKFTTEVECNSGKPTFQWDFGDGSTSTEANPTHSYPKEGEYVASVTVTGPSGGTDNDEMDVVVEKDAKEPKAE